MQQYHKYYRAQGNPVCVELDKIPTLSYDEFYEQTIHILHNSQCRCVNYFANRSQEGLVFYMVISDRNNDILIYSFTSSSQVTLDSITAKIPSMHVFEREISENFGVKFNNHPWLKPLRYAFDREVDGWMDSYPFYKIDSSELHEVGVGPIHAGVIEPGHFRFICNGEKVLHLEIQLGYQHRGAEAMMVNEDTLLKKSVLSENIVGDSAVSNGLAFAMVAESLSGTTVNEQLAVERVIAQEMERIAIHIGDTAALCADIAYQLGQVVCEALRTITINTTQFWCGNRFGKGLIRPLGTNYPLTDSVAVEISKNMSKVLKEYTQFCDNFYSLPSVLSRFEGIGEVTHQQGLGIGVVGMAARMTGIERDVRKSNPYMAYPAIEHEPILVDTGDVMARATLRTEEVKQSINRVLALIENMSRTTDVPKPRYDIELQPNSFAISLVEGWRGEICHVAITNGNGAIEKYKVKDPSLHNWFALALAVRDQEISDFPICNKSFDLSYCGFDL